MAEGVDKNIVLVGFTSSGKSTVGKYLSQRLLWKFFDIDQLVSARIGSHQDKFIEENGWDKFRDEEHQTILQSIAQNNSVIATGGGTLLGGGSRSWLKEHGTWLYLEAPFSELYGRIQQRGDRPLAQGWSREKAQAKFMERLPYYEQAQLRIKVSGSVNDIAEDAFEVIKESLSGVPYEFWFRKEYESLIQSKKLTSFVRPGNRLIPAPKGTSVGAQVRMRTLERPSTLTTLPELTDFTAAASVVGLEVKRISEMNKEDFSGASSDAASPSLVRLQLESLYNRAFSPSDTVTVCKISY